MSTTAIDYVRLMDATWALLHASQAGRRRVLDALPPAEQRALEAAVWPGLDVELARRRKTLSVALLETYATTYFAFVATAGAEGVMKFLESEAWSERLPQPGSMYPAAATAAAAFRIYLETVGWVQRQQIWLQQAYAFESALLFGSPSPPPGRRVDGCDVRLVAGTWVAEAPFDVLLAGKLLRQRGQEDPWFDAIYWVKPVPCPTVVLSRRDADRVRRVRLSGATALALRWLWDPDQDVPPGALETAAFRHLRDRELVSSGT